ncbi:atherin [Rhinatrema bivittatum]|uniref:atherin n=1 Tax=Rhinatrema bivittatum TaxID=194408 RepID=UPI001127AC6A|nr:atherin [Rhinatrema bivittatum]
MAGPPSPPPLAPSQPHPRYEEWILDTIDSLRSRKARPDLERICRMVRRRHGPEPERTRQELERLIQRRAVLRVSYKGSISYRNAARVQPPRGRRGTAAGQGQLPPPPLLPPPSQHESPAAERQLPDSRSAGGEQQWAPARAAERETPPPPRNRTKGSEQEKDDDDDDGERHPGEREAPSSRSGGGNEPRDGGSAEREAPRSRSGGSGHAQQQPPEKGDAEREAPRSRGAHEQQQDRGSAEPSPRSRTRGREPSPRSRSRCGGEEAEARTRSATRRPQPPGWGKRSSSSSSERFTRGRAREQRRRERLQRSRGSLAPARPARIKKAEQAAEEAAEPMLSEGSEAPDDEEEEEEEAGSTAEGDEAAKAATPEASVERERPPEAPAPCRMNGDLWREGQRVGRGTGEASGDGGGGGRCLSCRDPLPERDLGACRPPKGAAGERFGSRSCPPIESAPGGGTFARAVEEAAYRGSTACPPDPTTATGFPLETEKTEGGGSERGKGEESDIEGAHPRVFVPFSPGKSVMHRVNRISYRSSLLKKENPVEWTVTDVVDYFTEAGFGDQASAFKEQEIDGKSLLLMQRTDVLTGLSIRLGPALKIYEYHIKVLQQCHFEEEEGDCFLG